MKLWCTRSTPLSPPQRLSFPLPSFSPLPSLCVSCTLSCPHLAPSRPLRLLCIKYRSVGKCPQSRCLSQGDTRPECSYSVRSCLHIIRGRFETSRGLQRTVGTRTALISCYAKLSRWSCCSLKRCVCVCVCVCRQGPLPQPFVSHLVGGRGVKTG